MTDRELNIYASERDKKLDEDNFGKKKIWSMGYVDEIVLMSTNEA